MSGFKRTRGVHTAVHAAGEVHGSAPFLDGDMLVDSNADDAVTTRLQPDIEAGARAPPASCKRARAREDVDETGRCDARTDGAWIDALPAGGGNSSSGGGLSRAGSQDMTPASAADAAHSRQEDVTTLAYATAWRGPAGGLHGVRPPSSNGDAAVPLRAHRALLHLHDERAYGYMPPHVRAFMQMQRASEGASAGGSCDAAASQGRPPQTAAQPPPDDAAPPSAVSASQALSSEATFAHTLGHAHAVLYGAGAGSPASGPPSPFLPTAALHTRGWASSPALPAYNTPQPVDAAASPRPLFPAVPASVLSTPSPSSPLPLSQPLSQPQPQLQPTALTQPSPDVRRALCAAAARSRLGLGR